MNRKRHAAHCTVCAHPEAKAIEAGFLEWESPRSLERQYSLPQTSVWRHAKAFDLYEKRQDNLVGVLERIIEKGLTKVPNVSAANLIEAVKTHAKLTGQWVDRTQELPVEAEGRTPDELLFFAKTGRWPDEVQLEQ